MKLYLALPIIWPTACADARRHGYQPRRSWHARGHMASRHAHAHSRGMAHVIGLDNH